MKLKELRRIMAILAPLEDDVSVNIDFGGYCIDDDHIESVQITDDKENISVDVRIGGKAYSADCDVEEIRYGQGQPDHISPYESDTVSAEKEMLAIKDALEKCSYNKTLAAQMLGVSTRTVYRKMRQYGLHG